MSPIPCRCSKSATYQTPSVCSRRSSPSPATEGAVARYEFRLPDIGEGLAEAELAKWLVAVGESVTEDQPVVEMMTDKATVEQRAGEGDVVKTGAVLYVLETEAHIGGASAAAPPEAVRPVEAVAAESPAAGVLAPPAVRKLAREIGVDLARVKGSGPGGRITAENVRRHSEQAAAPSAPAAGAGQRLRLRGIQKRMAETMSQ